MFFVCWIVCCGGIFWRRCFWCCQLCESSFWSVVVVFCVCQLWMIWCCFLRRLWMFVLCIVDIVWWMGISFLFGMLGFFFQCVLIGIWYRYLQMMMLLWWSLCIGRSGYFLLLLYNDRMIECMCDGSVVLVYSIK